MHNEILSPQQAELLPVEFLVTPVPEAAIREFLVEKAIDLER